MSCNVAVVGAGVIGVTSALHLLQRYPHLKVTLLSDAFTPNTTGDGSAGFWYPYLPGELDHEILRRWCKETFQYFLERSKKPEGGKEGIGLLTAYHVSQFPMQKTPVWDQFIQYRELTEPELRAIFPEKYKYGHSYTTLFAECTKLLPALMKEFKKLGGKIKRRKVKNLKELVGHFDIIINCTGLDSYNVANDHMLFPIRGQVYRVRAPWIKHAIVADDFHILPNSDHVTMGGTKQKNRWDTEVDEQDSKSIWEGCCEMIPSLRKANVVKQWVGLRPGRSKPRLEKETIVVGNKTAEVIHNYGHGGSGVTLCWGCAKDVGNIVEQILSTPNMKSKL